MGPLTSHSWKKGRRIGVKMVNIMGPLKSHAGKKADRSGSIWAT